MPRMRILSPSEQEAFDKPPLLDHRERKKYFDLPKTLMDAVARLRTPASQIGYVLACGYFRATKRFYLPQGFHQRDIDLAARMLGLQISDFTSDAYAKQTRARHHHLILDFHGFTSFDQEIETGLVAEIETMARTHLKPRLMFDRCVDHLIQHRVQVPRSGVLLELIRSGLHARKAELIGLMDAQLTDDARTLIDDLFTTVEDQNRYRLTLLKKLSQSTRPTKIKEAIADFKTLATLHGQLLDVLTALDLGVAGVRYYAGSVLRSEMFQIQRRGASDRYIHAAAFVGHQFYRSQDNLIDLWLSVMASFQTTATREHNEHLLENRKAQQKHLKAVVDDLDTSVFGLIRNIRDVTEADTLSDAQKIIDIRTLLDHGKTGAFDRLKNDLAAIEQDQSWFEVLEARSLRLQNRLSPILRVITFDQNARSGRLIAAIYHFKTHESISAQVPTGFLNNDERAALTREDGTFRTSLYKVFLFQHITTAIKSGVLNLSQSYKYRPMDAYLIDPERWKREKQHLLDQGNRF